MKVRSKPERKPSRSRRPLPASVVTKTRVAKRVPATPTAHDAPAGRPAGLPVAADPGRGAVAAMVESGAIVARGLEGLGRAWFELTQATLWDGAATARAIMVATSPQQVIDLQAGFAGAALGRLVEQGGRLSALSLAVAGRAVAPLQGEVGVAVGRLWRPAA